VIPQHPDQAPVLAQAALFVIDQGPVFANLLHKLIALFRFGIQLRDRTSQDFLAGCVAINTGEGVIALEKTSVESGTENACEISFEELPVASLRPPQRFFRSPALSDVAKKPSKDRWIFDV